jgi:hypothetical protein
MKKLVLVGFASVVLVVPASGSAASKVKHCSYDGSAVQNLRAKKTTCKTARKVVQADLQGKRYRGFKCKSKEQANGTFKVTCKKGAKRVWYVVQGG